MSSSQIPVDRYADATARPAQHLDPRVPLYGLANDEHAAEMIEAIETLIVPDPHDVFAGPGYAAPAALKNGTATAGLYFAIGSIPIPLLWPVGLILGIMGMIKAYSMRKVGMHQAIAALVICMVVALVWVMMFSALYWTPSR